MKIIKGKRIKPLALLVYGMHGLGKSQFGSESEKPIFIGSEENDEMDVDRFERVKTWSDLTSQLSYLIKESHDYKTVVIDTIDALEQIAEIEILKKAEKGKTMATAFGGYGKAYEKLANMFLEIREKYLVRLRDEKGMNVIILAHAEKYKHEDDLTMTSYDTYKPSLHKKIAPYFQDWVSAIFFITYKNYKVQNSEGKDRAIGDGQRIILTEERPSHIAKNRFDLPEEIEFDKNVTFREISIMIKNYFAKSPEFKNEGKPIDHEAEEIKTEISEILKRVNDESVKDRINLAIERSDDEIKELKRIKTKAEKLTA